MGQLWEKRKKQWQSWWLCFAALELLKKITQYKATSKLDLLPLGICAEHQNQSLLVACFSSTRLAVDLS